MTYISLFILRLKKLLVILPEFRLRRALIQKRVMAGVEHKAVLSRQLATVVDIGANRGQFALAARALSGATVVSFEPLPDAAAIYRRVLGDDPSVRLHVAAIGEKCELKPIHLSARDDSSSLLEIGSAQSEYFPGTQEIGTMEVEVGTLDRYLSKDEIVHPAMLKLDVQGFEMQALAGCRNLIDNFDYIYCECSFVELYKNQKLAGEVVGFLYTLGFELAGMYNPSYDCDGNCIQADLFFEKTER